jgi:hypothetical protein
MEESLREHGKKTICMGMEFTHGKMEGDTKENMQMTKSTEKESTIGPMAGSLKVLGTMASNMETEFTSLLTALQGKDFGKKEKELDG